MVTKPVISSNIYTGESHYLGTKFEEANLEGQERSLAPNIAGFDRDMVCINASEHLGRDPETGDIYKEVDAMIMPGKTTMQQGIIPDKFANEWVERHEDDDHEHYKRDFEKDRIAQMQNIPGVYLTSKPLDKGHIGLNKVNPILERIRIMENKAASKIQMKWKYKRNSLISDEKIPNAEPVLAVHEEKPILLGQELVYENIEESGQFANHSYPSDNSKGSKKLKPIVDLEEEKEIDDVGTPIFTKDGFEDMYKAFQEFYNLIPNSVDYNEAFTEFMKNPQRYMK